MGIMGALTLGLNIMFSNRNNTYTEVHVKSVRDPFWNKMNMTSLRNCFVLKNKNIRQSATKDTKV